MLVDTPVDGVIAVVVVGCTLDEDLVEETGVVLGTVVVGAELGSPCVDADEDELREVVLQLFDAEEDVAEVNEACVDDEEDFEGHKVVQDKDDFWVA